jgi:hypothetical protein
MGNRIFFKCSTLLLIAGILFGSCNGGRTRGQESAGKRENVTDGVAADASTIPVSPKVNVYIENSGSMDGYVKGVTDFETAVYSYLSDILISGVSDSLNLCYINSKIIEYGSDVEDFIKKLEPSTFRARGGNRGASDIANVIDAVLTETKQNYISILVTDGIFSPERGKDASEYLVNQQIGIKRRMSDYLKKFPNTAVIVYQLSSNFNGIYYNKVDAGIQINEQRPFYIWVIGNSHQVRALQNKAPGSKFKGSGIQNVYTAIPGNQTVKYALNPSIGKYRKSKTNTKNTIENLGKDSRSGKVKFAVNIDFSTFLLDENYLLDSNNYENDSKYDLEIKSTKGSGYTHTLTFTSDKVYKETVSVKLKAQLPGWIENVNDDDGTTAVKGKTYGIKYQIGGIFEAYTFDNNYYTKIKINIK